RHCHRTHWNLVIGKWPARGGVVDLDDLALRIDRRVRRQIIRKISSKIGGGWQDRIVRIALCSDPCALVSEEKERTVSFDRSTDSAPELISLQRICRSGEKVTSIKLAVTHKFEQIA